VTGCLGDETIAAYVDGALDLDEVGRVDRHIDGCATCRSQLSSVAASVRSFTSETMTTAPGIAVVVQHAIAEGRAGDPLPETALGRYLIDGVIGRGGMGVVVRARDPELDRHVAIKLVDPSQRRGGWRSRLRAEARAMARLRHPNVVAVYDAGAIGEQAFVAMELVDGESLGRRLARDRSGALAPCLAAGRGLVAAHAAGIVHGDIKPDNILIDHDGRALVGDFGLARAIADDAAGGVVGTPAYMAPELLRGEPATPASDQYALAVTVYEAITGVRPRGASTLDELRRECEREIARPAAMSRRLWRVVARGLAADPARRYPSVADFVDALDRASRSRVRWFAGAAAAVGAVAIAAGVVLPSPSGATCKDPVERVRPLALPASCTSAACAALRDELDARAAAWRTTHVAVCEATREGTQSAALLDRRMACLDQGLLEHAALVRRLGERAIGNADALDALAAVQRLDRPERCATFDRPAPASDPEARGWVAAAKADQVLGHYQDGLAGLAPHWDAIRGHGDPALVASAATVLGDLQVDAGQLSAAEATFEAGLRAAAAAGDDAASAALLLHLAHLMGESRQQWDRGAELLRAADAAVVRAGNPNGLQATLELDRGLLDEDRGEYARAAGEYAQAVELRRKAGEPADLANALELECGVEGRTGALAQARAHCEEALALALRALGPDHPEVAEAETNLGVAVATQGDLAGARRIWESALARLERSRGADSPGLAPVLLDLGDVALALRDPAAAERYLARAAALVTAEPNSASSLDLRIRMAGLARETGKADDGIHMLEDVARRAEATFGLAHPTTGHALEDLAAAYYDASRMTEARDTFARAVQAAQQLYGEHHPTTLGIEGRYGQSLMELGDAAAARPIFERVMLALEASAPADSPLLAQAYTNFADALLATGEPARAAEIAAKGLAIRDKRGDDPLQTSEARFILGKAMWRARKDPAAVAVVRRARDEMKAIGEAATSLPEAERWLAGKR